MILAGQVVLLQLMQNSGYALRKMVANNNAFWPAFSHVYNMGLISSDPIYVV